MVSLRNTPLVIWLIYALGVVALAYALLLATIVATIALTDDVTVGIYVSTRWMLVWAAVIVLAVGTGVWRRQRGRA